VLTAFFLQASLTFHSSFSCFTDGSVQPDLARITAHHYYFHFLVFVFRGHENSAANVISCNVHVCDPGSSDPACVNSVSASYV
jgi:hypothetical protein